MQQNAKYYYLDKNKIHDFIISKNPKIFFTKLASIYVLIGLVFCLFSYFANLKFFFFVAIGLLQYLLVQALHEAWHYHKGRNFFESLFVTNLLSLLLFMPLSARKVHFKHHKDLGHKLDDPDYIKQPKSITEFIFNCIFFFSGVDAIKRFFFYNNKKNKSNRDYFGIIYILITQLIFYFLLKNFFKISLMDYIILWPLPIITIVNGLNKLRLLAEHGINYDSQCLRSFSKKKIINKFFGAFGFTDHAEHHVYPNLRHHQLKKIKKSFDSSDFSESKIKKTKVEYIDEDYISFILRTIKNS